MEKEIPLNDAQHQAARRLHQYLIKNHWRDQALIGPDPGVRFNYRLFRFIKSYLRIFPWRDDLYYLQGQGYWALANWQLYILTGEDRFRTTAIACSDTMLKHQQPDGAWAYPNPEWKGRYATAEGVWAALGLIETYRQTGERRFLDGIMSWYQFMMTETGFQRIGDQLSVNYFAHRQVGRVPNNTAFVLRFLAELSQIKASETYLTPCKDLLKFLEAVQKDSGEFPYCVPGENDSNDTPHFQCYQYNAFQCLDLMRYVEITGDTRALPLIKRVLAFLRGGLGKDGHLSYDCDSSHHTVTYHTAAAAAAFDKAIQFGFDNYQPQAELAYQYVLGQQHQDGSFPHSRGDYKLLADRRSYPRYLAMILYHLLHPPMTKFSQKTHEIPRREPVAVK
jgi:prenyltransferase beta subunit